MQFKDFFKGSLFIVLLCGLFLNSYIFVTAVNTPRAPTAGISESGSIVIRTIPTNPTPGQNITVTITSYNEDLDTSTIDWFIDNKLVSSGVGIKSIPTQAPTAGSEITVLVQVTLAENISQSQAHTIIRSAEMDLLFEAIDSFVPPFYKGKALPGRGSFIKVVAMPNIQVGSVLVKPSNLTYTWQKNFTNIQDGLGYGKNYITYKNDYLSNSENIGVTASTTDGKYSSTARMYITPVYPLLSFYKEDASLGVMWEKTLENPHKINNTETIVAIPYYISPKDIRIPYLQFKWLLNGTLLSMENNYKNKIPLRVEEGISGSSTLELQIDNTKQFYQTARGSIRLQF